ncbi:MAG: radical SAM protein [Clostridia bacterium]|nr:radical SAM protein [Clostridia bacterium]
MISKNDKVVKKGIKIDGRMLVVELTNQCNFSCPFCFNKSSRVEHHNTFMHSLDFLKLIENMHGSDITEIALSGGEPTLHPELMLIMGICLKYGYKVRLITNGYLLTENLLDFIVRSAITLQLSMDGGVKETHDYYRIPGSFEKNIRTLRYLFDCGYRSGIIRSTITNKNFGELNNLYKIAKEYNFEFSISIVQRLGLPQQDWEQLNLSNESYGVFLDSLLLIAQKDPVMVSQISNVIPIVRCPLIHAKILKIKPLVDVYGYLYPCHSLFKENYRMGNIFSNSLENVLDSYLDSPQYKCIVNDFYKAQSEKCTNCKFASLKICMGGCHEIMCSASTNDDYSNNCVFKERYAKYMKRMRDSV